MIASGGYADLHDGRPRSLPLKLRPVRRISYLGLPRFQWSLTLLGLCIFTFAIITFYVNIAEVGIALAVVGLFLDRNQIRVPFPVGLYAVFVSWTFISSLASVYPEIALAQAVERLKLLVIILVVVNALRTEGQLRFYLLFFLGCFVLFPVRGTLVGGDTLSGRAVWNYIYNNPNDLAALSLLALGIALAFTMSETSRTLVRFAAAISAMLLFVVILLTQSRGAFLGLIAATATGFLPILAKQPRKAIVLIAIVALLASFVIPTKVWERLAGIKQLTSVETIAEADAEGSAAQRYEIQQVAWQVFRDHPVFGVGLGVYPQANALYAPHLGRRDTHNTYLNLAAEVGLPGLLLWCLLFWSVLRYAYRSRRHGETSGLATEQVWIERVLVGYLIAGSVGTYSALTFPYLMLATLWCSANLLLPSPSRPAPNKPNLP